MVGDTLTARGLAVLLALACAAAGCVTSEVTLPRQGKLGVRVGTSQTLNFNGSLVDEEGNVGPKVLDADGAGGLLLEAEYFVIDQLSLTATVRSNDIDWSTVGGSSGKGRVDEFAVGTRVYLVHPAWRQRAELFAGIDFSGISHVRVETKNGAVNIDGDEGETDMAKAQRLLTLAARPDCLPCRDAEKEVRICVRPCLTFAHPLGVRCH